MLTVRVSEKKTKREATPFFIINIIIVHID